MASLGESVLARTVQQQLRQGTAANCVVATATGVAITFSVNAIAGQQWAVDSFLVSYSGTPTGGNVLITGSNSVTYMNTDITISGNQTINANLALPENVGLTVTLAAAGAVTGKMNIIPRAQ